MNEDLTGKTLGPFQIERRIGRGAMGAVYTATHRQNGKRVAIKVMTPANEAQAVKLAARFEREIKLLGKFRHPNIVRFYGASEDQGIRFYAMELVEGMSLDDLLEKEGVLSFNKTAAYAIQICEALQEMHATGVIHRDLKPGNVLVTSDGKVKLTDFGIARDTSAFSEERLTAADHTVGTIAYMSPEQLAGQELTRKSDLYSLGILIYRMLTGQLPFNGETMFEYMQQRQTGRYPAPTTVNADLPLDADRLLADLLAQEPDDRPRDAYVVMQRLMDITKKPKTATITKTKPKVVEPMADTVENGKSRFSTLLATVFGTRDRKTKKVKSKSDEKSSNPAAILESPILLGAGLILVVAFVAYMLWPPGPEELFAKGEALMKQENVTLDQMVMADHDYFEPILVSDPTSPLAPKIAQYRDQIKLQQSRGRVKQALLLNIVQPDATDAEKKLIAAMKLKDRDPANAADQFRAIVRVFANNPAAKPWVTLASEQLLDAPTYASDEQRIEEKRIGVRRALEEATELRKGGNLREALDKYASVEELYGEDPEVSDLIWKAGTDFLPPDDLFARGEKLMKSGDVEDWKRAFKQYFDPLVEKGTSPEIVAKVDVYREQLLQGEAAKKADEDLRVGIHAEAPPAEVMYVTAIYVRDQLDDPLSAYDHLNRLVGRFEEEKDAKPWVLLAKDAMKKDQASENREARTGEKQYRAERALDKMKKEVARDPDKKAWLGRVISLYEDDPDTKEIAAKAKQQTS
jgi:serine/threonine-protein kinase